MTQSSLAASELLERHINRRYEYLTREYPYSVDRAWDDPTELMDAGWRRAWADLTLEGIFVVYRRERKPA